MQVSARTVEQMEERLAFIRRDDGKIALAWEHLHVPFEIKAQE
ncbi:MAG: hypothetical protein R3B47_06825 [Bacteroidia bacterium]